MGTGTSSGYQRDPHPDGYDTPPVVVLMLGLLIMGGVGFGIVKAIAVLT